MIDIDMLLTSGATYKKVATGETIFTEGNNCNFYYQLVSGNIKWMNIDENGKEFVQYYIQAGDCFGELPLFDDQPYAASAIAENDCVVIRLHKPVFWELLADQPELFKTFACLLASRIRFKMFVLKELVHHTPEHRIASMIEYFKSSHTTSTFNVWTTTKLKRKITNMIHANHISILIIEDPYRPHRARFFSLHHHDVRHARNECDWREILDRVVGKLGE